MEPIPGSPDNQTCRHVAQRFAGLHVVACGNCGHVEYRDPQGSVASAVALARLFGDFDLAATLPALHAPGHAVRLYEAPTRAQRRHLAAFPAHQWFEVDEGLWLAHDERYLLLATSRPIDLQLTGA